MVDELFKIQHSADKLPEVDFADRFKQRTTEASEKVSSQFTEILEFAHFDYDKKKIHFRQEDEAQEPKRDKTEIRKLASKKAHEKTADIRRRAKQIMSIPHEQVCPECGHEPLTPTEAISRRFIVDLALTENGIEKTVTEYTGIRAFCSQCTKTYAPLEVRKYPKSSMYGHGLGAWVVYQRVALRLPYESIVESAFEQFGETFNVAQPQNFLKQFAKYYANTERQIAENLLRSQFVHVDETKVNIQGANWCVWVLTDGRYVIFKLTDTRETTIVQEFLTRYQGVLITDFYGGYDSVQCRQQRCWAHLVGDLNDDLREHPFDKEYEVFVLEVRDLILPIMEVVQQFSLCQ